MSYWSVSRGALLYGNFQSTGNFFHSIFPFPTTVCSPTGRHTHLLSLRTLNALDEFPMSEFHGKWKIYFALSFLRQASLILWRNYSALFVPKYSLSISFTPFQTFSYENNVIDANTIYAYLQRNSPQSTGRNLSVFLGCG